MISAKRSRILIILKHASHLAGQPAPLPLRWKHPLPTTIPALFATGISVPEKRDRAGMV
jgi:hypothetical protein